VKFALIDAEKAHFPVAFMCSQLSVSRSGFYAWLKRAPSPRAREDVELGARVLELHLGSQRRYGSPRIHRALTAEGRNVSRKRVVRLMRERGLVARPKLHFVATTNSEHELPVAPNVLARQFDQSKPDLAWASDITYLWTAEGWLYLAVILDLFSRMVVGWAMAATEDEQLVELALRMAVAQRHPPAGLLHHSDRGSEFTSDRYLAVLAELGIQVSMSRTANCYDNAAMESFFATLTKECIDRTRFQTRQEARVTIFEYLECFYNPVRLHATLLYSSPIAFEQANESKRS
jgi:putative transposase